MDDLYLCKSSREIPEAELKFLAKNLNCSIKERGKVKGEERWDYLIEKPYMDTDIQLLQESGLVPLLTPEQEKAAQSQPLRTEESSEYAEFLMKTQ